MTMMVLATRLLRVAAHSSRFIGSYPQPGKVVLLDKSGPKRCNPPFFLIQGI